jgi:phytoene synthase
MTPDGAQGSDYLLSLLQRNDEDLHLSLRYAPAAERPRLAALFALQVELRRLPFLVREAPAGEIRLQWWRDSLAAAAEGAGPRNHPILEGLAATRALSAPALHRLRAMIDARARLLYERSFSSFAEFMDFMRETEAPLAELALAESDPSSSAKLIGEAYALARFAPIMARPYAPDAAERSRALHRRHAPALRALPAAHAGRVAYLALAPGYAARPDGRDWRIGKRLALFRAVATGRF